MRWRLTALVALVLLLLTLSPAAAQSDDVTVFNQTLPVTWTELAIYSIVTLLSGGGVVGLVARNWVKQKENEYQDRTQKRNQDHEAEMAQLKTQDKLIDKFGAMVEAVRDHNALLMDATKRQGALEDLALSQNKLLLDVSDRMTRADEAVEGKLDTVRDIMLQIRQSIRPSADTDDDLDAPSVLEVLRRLEEKIDRRLPKTGQLHPTPSGPTLMDLEKADILITPPPTSSTTGQVILQAPPPGSSVASTTNPT